METRRLMNIAVIFVVALAFAACSGEKPKDTVEDPLHAEEAGKHEEKPDVTRTEAGKPQFTVDEIFRKQLTTVFDSYVELKDAFVSSDAEKVKKEASKTQEDLKKVDMKLVSGAAHNDWMTYVGDMESSLASIAGSTEIEAQRTEFSKLSNALYKAIKAYGLSEKTAYYEFCPMAFDDKGAHWLSDEAKIRNPYFGDKMLTCGSVEETLQ
jgi:hypothetical protein